jgi:DNA segregation ATPase FtsK/SpoIIIE-like protein
MSRLVQAVGIAVRADFASAGFLSRRLQIPYGQACALIERMHQLGIVGDYDGVDTRVVVLPLAEALAVAGSVPEA